MQSNGLLRWDLTPLYISFSDQHYLSDRERLQRGLADLERLLENYRVGGDEPVYTAEAFFAVADALNAVRATALPLKAFAFLRQATDAGDREAAAAISELEGEMLALERLTPRIVRWWGSFEIGDWAGDYALLLREARVRNKHLMSDAEETLAAELSLSGARAWTRHYGNVSSRISVRFEGGDLPITALRNLAYDPDGARRKAAYEAELAAWETRRDELAASLNGVKGSRIVINRRRGWEDSLAPTLLANRISRATLYAMQKAVEGSLPVWRRYFLAKARSLGKERLDWWDLFAPIARERREWGWEEARSFIVKNLREFSPAAADLADRAFRERWIDAEPRKGKRGGAFCMHIGDGVSRVLANFTPSFDAVSTLAHELGHAYHNFRLSSRPPLLRETPMTLAETASIMNETVITRAALAETEGEDALAILDSWLAGAAQAVVDIHSRFLFESQVFERRSARELSPEEFSEAMLEAQKLAYGDALASYHRYMWAVKPHYYGRDYYNYPYTFGLLFGLGLYRAYRESPLDFQEEYDRLLADTGVAGALELAARFGFNLEEEDFWADSLALLAEDVGRFERAIG